MGMKTIQSNFRYSTKTSAAKDASWIGSEFSVEYALGDDEDTRTVAAALDSLVKTLVFSALEIMTTENESGVIMPLMSAAVTAPAGGSGGASRGPGQPPSPERLAVLAAAPKVNGWLDFRASKTSGSTLPNHPDFKNEDSKESVWLVDKEGAATERGAELASMFAAVPAAPTAPAEAPF